MAESIQKFKASLDTLATIGTITIVGLTLFFTIAWSVGQFEIGDYDQDRLRSFGLPAIILLLAVVGSWLFSPQGYSVGFGDLIIHRPIKHVSVRVSQLKSAQLVSKSDMPMGARTFGVGGLFGYFGKFYNRKFGHMTYYVTQLNNYVVVKTKAGKTLVLSPNDPSRLCALLNDQIKSDHSA